MTAPVVLKLPGAPGSVGTSKGGHHMNLEEFFRLREQYHFAPVLPALFLDGRASRKASIDPCCLR